MNHKKTSSFLDLIPTDSHLLIGLSGGPDSVYLLHRMQAARQEKNITITAVHINHEWRESASLDEEFCKKRCHDLTIPLIVRRASDYPPELFTNRGSAEDLARQLRRHVFEEVRQEVKADFIVLAHTQDDQEENFFIRLIRGTTLAGLVGMQQQEGVYLRPLLLTSKKEILDFLAEHNISYAIDPTNESDRFLRNKIRQSVIPPLRALDTRFDDNCIRTMHHLNEAYAYIMQEVQAAYAQVYTDKKLSINTLKAYHPYLQRELIKYWLIQEKVDVVLTELFIEEVIRFLYHERGGSHTFNTWLIEKKSNKASIISKKNALSR